MFIDTHAHLHFIQKKGEPKGSFETGFSDIHDVLERAYQAGVTQIINIGVDPADSRVAIRMAADKTLSGDRTGVSLYATAGLHPHEAAQGDKALDVIHDMAEDVVAIGECGLDYFKNQASREEQIHALRGQLAIALEHNLPLVFHVRDAWDDFFSILAEYPKAKGVIHSFTGHPEHVEQAFQHPGKLYFGLNGIMTFTKDTAQLEAARAIAADRLLLETDCPFLAPLPYRGKRNEPSYVPIIAEFLATLRGVSIDDLASQTRQNALDLFGLDE
ncbi:MAG: TatD family hydrolase [bacterium]